MTTQQKNVIVINNDPQILKGLKLLLEDMSLNVLASSSQTNLDYIHTACPDLLIFPLLLDNGDSGTELAEKLRIHYNKNIPVILISTNNLNIDWDDDPSLTLLSDHVKPHVLRQQIKSLLA